LPRHQHSPKAGRRLGWTANGDTSTRPVRWPYLPRYESATEFSEGLAAVKVGDKWGCVDKTGQMVIPPQFFVRYYPCFADYHFFGGVARVWVGQELAYIDVKGKFVWGPVKEKALLFLLDRTPPGTNRPLDVDQSTYHPQCDFIG
jgi:hypothetical protein